MVKNQEEEMNELMQLQMIEQALQNLVMQKQVFQGELVETKNALEELKKNKEEVFKIIGSLLFKADKKEVEKELEKKRDIISLRLKAIENQEEDIREKSEGLRKKVMESMK